MSEHDESNGDAPIEPTTPGVPEDPDTHPRGPRGRAESSYREVTLAALALAIVVGLVMNASITYAGLKIGFTIGGSAIAAVVGFGILRGLLRAFVKDAGSVLEVNIAQTVASAVNTSNSGIIFTVPVLFLIGFTIDWGQIDFWLIALAGVAGAILGTAFIIPLRKQMIEIDRLRFPTGVGVATILKSPGGGVKKTLVLLAGIGISALMYAPTSTPTLPTGPVAQDRISGVEQRPVSELIEARRDKGDLDTLDRQVLSGRLSPGAAEITRDINSWLIARDAPDQLVARGGLVAERRDATKRLTAAKEALCEVPIPAGTRDLIASIKAEIEEIDERLGSDEFAEVAHYSDDLARAVHAIEGRGGVSGTGDDSVAVAWDDLRDTRLGWASTPFWGYQELQLRLYPYGDPDNPGHLHERVDRDGNDQPDLIVTDSTVDLGRAIGLPDEVQLIFAIAPFALGAGFITGRAGLLVLAGGVLAFLVINPIVFNMGWLPETVEAKDAPAAAFGAFNRPLGIGLLLGGALMGVLFALPAIMAAFKSVATAGRTAGRGGRDELGIAPLIVAVLLAGVLLFFAADILGSKPINKNGICPITGIEVSCAAPPSEYKGYSIAFADADAKAVWDNGGVTGEGEAQVTWDDDRKLEYLASKNARPGWLAGLPSHLRAAIIAVVGVLWIWFAGIIIAQCTGMTDWSPISGMALLTVVLVLLMAGTGAVMGAVLVGAALCVAITLAADMMQDLKTGHMIGARPIRQQTVELLTVWIGPVVSLLVVLLIVQVNLKTTGIAMGPGTPTAAPQAQALQAIITGVQGGEMPYMLYGLGVLLGALLGLGSFAGLGVLVGLSMYLPFMYIATYGIGCIANILLRAFKGPRWTEEWGVPFAAGLIVGESILALIFNIFILLAG